MNDRLKNIIFRKLYQDLSKLEIIPYRDSIFFIDRENKYWYFEYEKPGILWWRYDFFNEYFVLFSLQRNEYEPIISEWVEEVLNCKVNTTPPSDYMELMKVEEVLNCKVNTTCYTGRWISLELVEDVLNYKVNRVQSLNRRYESAIMEVLLREKE
jgi:hypothetical protein